MSDVEVWLVRHGETEWSRDHRHTSHTDLPLTDHGVEVARELAGRLSGTAFDTVLTSPRQRARRTAELAGFPDAEVDEDLVEWADGDYEGGTTAHVGQVAFDDAITAQVAEFEPYASRTSSFMPTADDGVFARRRCGWPQKICLAAPRIHSTRA